MNEVDLFNLINKFYLEDEYIYIYNLVPQIKENIIFSNTQKLFKNWQSILGQSSS